MPLFGRLWEGLRQHTLKVAREETPPRYIIDKIGDFVHVPEARLAECLAAVYSAFETIRDLQAAGMLSGKGTAFPLDKFAWIDDDTKTGTLHVENATVIIEPKGNPTSIFYNVKNPPRVPGDNPKG